MILEADKAVCVRHQIFLAQLNHRVRLPASARISQPNRLHRPEAERVDSAPRKAFDWETGFEPPGLLEALQRNTVRFDQGGVKALVFFAIDWAIEVIVTAFIIASRAKGNALVNRLG